MVLSRTERQAETRRDLIDAAERRFTDQGFHATSIDAVAREAGYTKGAVYSNFASKETSFSRCTSAGSIAAWRRWRPRCATHPRHSKRFSA